MKALLMTLLFLTPFAVTQTVEQRVCDAVKDPYSPQCVLLNGLPRTTTAMPSQPAPVVPTWTPPPTVPSVQEQIAIQQKRNAEYEVQKQSVTVQQNVVVQQTSNTNWTNSSYTNNQNGNDQTGAFGQMVGNAIATRIAGSIENHHINAFCKANPTSTYVTNTGVKVLCPSAPLDAYEQSEVDSYCANNPGSWTAFGMHRIDCLTPPNPVNLKWAKWEMKTWQWDYRNPTKVHPSMSEEQMRSIWGYWEDSYCGLAASGAKYKSLDGGSQRCQPRGFSSPQTERHKVCPTVQPTGDSLYDQFNQMAADEACK